MRAQGWAPRRGRAAPARQAVLRTALWLGLGVPPVLLAETSAEFQVTAEIRAGCLVNQVAPADGSPLGRLGTLDFGRHPGLSTATAEAALVADAGIVLACTPGTALSMSVDGGQHFQAGRRLRSGTAYLAYGLYRQSGCVDSIPPGTPVAVDTVTAPPLVSLPLHGCLTLPGDAPAGIYQDTLTITLSW